METQASVEDQIKGLEQALIFMGHKTEYSNIAGEIILEWDDRKVVGWTDSGEAYSSNPAMSSSDPYEFLHMVHMIMFGGGFKTLVLHEGNEEEELYWVFDGAYCSLSIWEDGEVWFVAYKKGNKMADWSSAERGSAEHEDWLNSFSGIGGQSSIGKSHFKTQPLDRSRVIKMPKFIS